MEILDNHLVQGDLTENYSIMALAQGINILDKCLANPGIPEKYYDNLSDGWYTAYQISIPDQEWLDRTINTCPETLSSYNTIYIIKDNQLVQYDYWTNTITYIDIKDILRNPNGKTNISISFLDFFITDSLESQFLSLLEESLKEDSCKKQTSCCEKSEKTDNLIEKRDQLLTFLELINYYVECGDYESAQDLLEKIDCFKTEELCCRKR